jgi:hypothetical protein
MNRPPSFTLTRMCSSIALVMLAGATTATLAQAPATQEHDHDAAAPPAVRGCVMTPEHRAMMTALAAGEQKLTELIAGMNAAKGEAKVEAIAAVVSELALQHARMRQTKGAMMDHMTSHDPAAPRHPQERRSP